jgi:stringent starvation protein B
MATAGEKQRTLNELLEQGVVLVQLDARRPGVRVPDELKEDMQLRLNFNYRKGKGDLVVNEWGLRETLSFKGRWFAVSVPWSAVYVAHLHGAEPVLFPEDMPEEMIEEALTRMQRAGYSLEELEEKRPQPLWKGREPQPAPAKAPAPAAAKPPEGPAPELAPAGARRGHLRLVK